MMEKLKVLCNTDNEALLSILADQCKKFALDYCNRAEYSEVLDEVVIMMVCERYNKLSADGISSRSYSGVSESYTDDFSPVIYKALQRYRKIRVI